MKLIDARKSGAYPSPGSEAAGYVAVYVGRLRDDISHPRCLDLWIVADNVRKGAAHNSIQIVEILLFVHIK